MAAAVSQTGVGKVPRGVKLSGIFKFQDSDLKRCNSGQGVRCRIDGLPDDIYLSVFPNGRTEEQEGWVDVSPDTVSPP